MTEPENASQDPTVAWLTDVLYTGVGLGVLAVNRFQVARRDLQQQIRAGEVDVPDLSFLGDIGDLADDPERASRIAAKLRAGLADLDERLDGVEHRIGAILADVEPDLPEPLRELSRAFRVVADDHLSQLRAALGLEAR